MICAAMIVKNEQAVIRRCLESLIGIVDMAVIVDTGSTDSTMEIICSFRGFPIERQERRWVDFAHNRNEVLSLAKTKADWTLRVDADQTIGGTVPPLNGDAFSLPIRHGTLRYRQPVLFRSALPWRYIGATHEYLTCDTHHQIVDWDGLIVTEHADSHRRMSGDKIPDDIVILEKDFAKDRDNPRTVFYLARAYDDSDEKDKAVEFYRKRINMGQPAQEVCVALLRMGRLRLDDGDGLPHLLAAWEMFPKQWESLYYACEWMSGKGYHHSVYAMIKQAMSEPSEMGWLFAEPEIYEYRLAFGYMAAAAKVKDYAGSIEAGRRLLAHVLPEHVRKQVESAVGEVKRFAGMPI